MQILFALTHNDFASPQNDIAIYKPILHEYKTCLHARNISLQDVKPVLHWRKLILQKDNM